jgi:DNA-binding NtrC family response regulator
VDARVVAATSEPLEAAVARGDFREDLLYRLDVIRLPVPPLRHRSGDLIFLFQHFVKRFAKTYKLPRPKVLKGFLDALLEFEWPGNVRQLENLTERLVLTHSGEALRADHFFELCRPGAPGDLPVSSPPPLPLESSSRGAHVNLDGTLEENIAAVVEPLERAYFEGILRRYRGRVGLVAEHAGVNRRTVLRKLRALGLEKHEYRDG